MRLVGVLQETVVGAQQWQGIWKPGLTPQPLPISAPPCPPPREQVRVDLLTPLRLRSGEHNVTPQTLQFADLFSSLLRRISLLLRLHASTPLEADFAGLSALARGVAIGARELRWYDWQRYSNRQQCKVPMGGVTGSFAIASLPAALWPFLWLGQWTHAGKGASMGLGRYRLQTAA